MPTGEQNNIYHIPSAEKAPNVEFDQANWDYINSITTDEGKPSSLTPEIIQSTTDNVVELRRPEKVEQFAVKIADDLMDIRQRRLFDAA